MAITSNKPTIKSDEPKTIDNTAIKWRWKHFLRGLYRHYTAPLETIFKQFKAGAIYFGVGLMTIFYANQAITPSVAQECVVLAALVMAAGGFIMAMLAYIRLVIGRVLRFIYSP